MPDYHLFKKRKFPELEKPEFPKLEKREFPDLYKPKMPTPEDFPALDKKKRKINSELA